MTDMRMIVKIKRGKHTMSRQVIKFNSGVNTPVEIAEVYGPFMARRAVGMASRDNKWDADE